jgi:hypothetical protein
VGMIGYARPDELGKAPRSITMRWRVFSVPPSNDAEGTKNRSSTGDARFDHDVSSSKRCVSLPNCLGPGDRKEERALVERFHVMGDVTIKRQDLTSRKIDRLVEHL